MAQRFEVCPNCQTQITCAYSDKIPNDKGMGKKTAETQNKLTEVQLDVFMILIDANAVSVQTGLTMRNIYAEYVTRAKHANVAAPFDPHYIGFCCSVLGGAGFLSIQNRSCKLEDQSTNEIRFRKTPVWYLSPAFIAGLVTVDVDTDMIIRKAAT